MKHKAGVAGQPEHICRLAEAGRGWPRLEAALRLSWRWWSLLSATPAVFPEQVVATTRARDEERAAVQAGCGPVAAAGSAGRRASFVHARVQEVGSRWRSRHLPPLRRSSPPSPSSPAAMAPALAACGAARQGRPSGLWARDFGPIVSHCADLLHSGTSVLWSWGARRAARRPCGAAPRSRVSTPWRCSRWREMARRWREIA